MNEITEEQSEHSFGLLKAGMEWAYTQGLTGRGMSIEQVEGSHIDILNALGVSLLSERDGTK